MSRPMLAAAFVVAAGGLCFGDLPIVTEGDAAATIVTPADATPTVAFAARELARYVLQITGADLKIVTEGGEVTGTPIHVGATSSAKDIVPGEPEGIAIVVDGDRVVICGGSDRGTLFAVYRFLEDIVGCRWLSPGIEYVPQRGSVALAPMELRTAPEFNMRVFSGRREDCSSWGVKMGMNGFYTAKDVEASGNGYYFPAKVPGCHAYCLIMPADEYFEGHPEWFPLIGGERVPGRMHGKQLCVTAPGLADEFARNVIAMFDEDASLQVASISPNDGRGWCDCEACKALDEKLCGARMTKQGLAGESAFVGDRVFWFANEVAERVAKVHPDKLLLVLAYINYAEPPDTIVPHENVVPWLCHYAPADYSRPISDPTSEANAQFNNLLVRWAEAAPHLLFYSYVSKSMWWRLPRPVMVNFAADVKYLHSLGIRLYYCQSSLSDWVENGLMYYVIPKLLWDPSLDPREVAADWVAHMFGEAAEPMAEYYALMEHSITESEQSFSDNPPNHVPGLFSMDDLAAAQAKLQEAMAAAKTGEVKDRVAQVEKNHDYGTHVIKCLEAAARFRREPSKADYREAVDEGEAALAIYSRRELTRFMDTIRMNDQMGVIASGFGEGEEKGGRKCWNSDETGVGDGAAGWATFMIETLDTSKPVRVEIDVWGESQLGQIVINTGGQGRGYSAGGVWSPVSPEKPLSGKDQWDTLVFVIRPELQAQGAKSQKIGFGGADSQVWISAVRVETME